MDDADDTGDEPPRHGTERPETEGDSGGESHGGAAHAAGPDADFRALAEDWIAIWQSEITAYLTDPETQQAWGAMIAVWAGAAQAMMRAVPPTPGFGAAGFGTAGFGAAGIGAPFGSAGMRPRGRQKPAEPRPAAPRPAAPTRDARGEPGSAQSAGADAAARAAPAAAAPVARDDEVRRLEQRVAELERLLADQDRRRGAAGEHRRPRRTGRPRG